MPWHAYRDHFLTDERIAAGVEILDRAPRAARPRSSAAPASRSTSSSASSASRPTSGASPGASASSMRWRRSPSTTRRAASISAANSSNSCCWRARTRSTSTPRSAPTRARWDRRSSCRAATAPTRSTATATSRRDLWGSWDDVIASVANYLAKHGWRAGEPVAAPASLWFPRADSARGRQPGAGHDRQGAARPRPQPSRRRLDGKAPAFFISLAGDQGPELPRRLPQLRRDHALQPQRDVCARGARTRQPHRGAAAAGAVNQRLALPPAARCSRRGLRAGTATAGHRRPLPAPRAPGAVPREEPRARLGNPPFYEVAGKRYVVLASAAGYVERGVASWYGPNSTAGAPRPARPTT